MEMEEVTEKQSQNLFSYWFKDSKGFDRSPAETIVAIYLISTKTKTTGNKKDTNELKVRRNNAIEAYEAAKKDKRFKNIITLIKNIRKYVQELCKRSCFQDNKKKSEKEKQIWKCYKNICDEKIDGKNIISDDMIGTQKKYKESSIIYDDFGNEILVGLNMKKAQRKIKHSLNKKTKNVFSDTKMSHISDSNVMKKYEFKKKYSELVNQFKDEIIIFDKVTLKQISNFIENWQHLKEYKRNDETIYFNAIKVKVENLLKMLISISKINVENNKENYQFGKFEYIAKANLGNKKISATYRKIDNIVNKKQFQSFKYDDKIINIKETNSNKISKYANNALYYWRKISNNLKDFELPVNVDDYVEEKK